jgi:hypothetical protein
MEYGRMVKVTSTSSDGGNDEAVLYVVGAEDSNEAMMLVENMVVIGSNIEVVGRVSHQLLDSLKIELGQVIRI